MKNKFIEKFRLTDRVKYVIGLRPTLPLEKVYRTHLVYQGNRPSRRSKVKNEIMDDNGFNHSSYKKPNHNRLIVAAFVMYVFAILISIIWK